MDKYLKAAIQNIARHGDTDVFPYPIENHIFFDNEQDALTLLKAIHDSYDDFVLKYPPVNENALAAVGYTGFRWATQIDPIWNAYFLALVISIGDDIEKRRIPTEKRTVFSYRFKHDDNQKTLFDIGIGWQEFQQTSVEFAQNFSYVLICDISDFYPRVYHHRLENALKKATNQTETIRRIMDLLTKVSKGVSYGLPVGGPAARLLSELLLDRVDRLLATSGIPFCRFADDYHVFANTREQAYANLVFLSEKLLENEGLSLQKSKTRVLTKEEFLATSEFAEAKDQPKADEIETRNFLSLRIRYDPYSPTAAEEYGELKNQLRKFDIAGMLAREINKSRIHQALTKRLIASVRYLDSSIRNDAIRSLIDNPPLLYPVFPNVMLLVKAILGDIDPSTRDYVFKQLGDLVRGGSHIIKVPVNLGYVIRVLAEDSSEETEVLLAKVFRESTSMVIRRDVILAMAKRNSDYWISDIKRSYSGLTDWERRSLIIASYILEDEGRHWRDQIKKELSPIDELYRKWAADRKTSKTWTIPL